MGDGGGSEYVVVINHEEQFSIWPSFKKVPQGWEVVGKPAPKEECLKYIQAVWVDMRPLSLRQAMALQTPKVPDTQNLPIQGRLVDFLSKGTHCVVFDSNVEEFKENLQRNYLHIRFPDTRGGTSIGISLNPLKTSFKDVDFEIGQGQVMLDGDLVLDGEEVGCIVDLNISDLKGRGFLYKKDNQ